MSGINVTLTESHTPKTKDKSKPSLFSSKWASEYKVAYESAMEINTERSSA